MWYRSGYWVMCELEEILDFWFLIFDFWVFAVYWKLGNLAFSVIAFHCTLLCLKIIQKVISTIKIQLTLELHNESYNAANLLQLNLIFCNFLALISSKFSFIYITLRRFMFSNVNHRFVSKFSKKKNYIHPLK